MMMRMVIMTTMMLTMMRMTLTIETTAAVDRVAAISVIASAFRTWVLPARQSMLMTLRTL